MVLLLYYFYWFIFIKNELNDKIYIIKMIIVEFTRYFKFIFIYLFINLNSNI